jgi:peptidoglycan/xylan/chitin deacetylase (PgdA/CDA1 family)
MATLYFFHPLQELLQRSPVGIPILMYHSISVDEETGRSAYYRTCTDPLIFVEQMAFLAKNRYNTIGLSEAAQRINGAAHDTERPVVLTFDDGYQDFYTEAFPILHSFGFSATVFLPTAYIGDNTLAFNGKACLTWGQVRELQRAGIKFGSHTVTHPQLRTLPTAALQRELRCSREEVENRLGAQVESFSYPYAFPEADRPFKDRVCGLLHEAGYQNGVSTIIGRADRNDGPWLMKRLPVNSCDDQRLFRAKLEGGYDWLHALQRASKIVRFGAGR